MLISEFTFKRIIDFFHCYLLSFLIIRYFSYGFSYIPEINIFESCRYFPLLYVAFLFILLSRKTNSNWLIMHNLFKKMSIRYTRQSKNTSGNITNKHVSKRFYPNDHHSLKNKFKKHFKGYFQWKNKMLLFAKMK